MNERHLNHKSWNLDKHQSNCLPVLTHGEVYVSIFPKLPFTLVKIVFDYTKIRPQEFNFWHGVMPYMDEVL